MNSNDEMPSRIRFHYDMDKNARLETVHGVWGGINPHGEIEMSFYNESDAIPGVTEQIVAPDGSLGHEMVEEESDVRHINRHIHTRILLNYNTARAVMEWLEDRLSELDEGGGIGGDIYGNPSGIEQ